MTRHSWTSMGYSSCSVGEATSSSNHTSFASFLTWAFTRSQEVCPLSANFCCIILGHGGGRFQICPDETPDPTEEVRSGSSGTAWMDAGHVGASLRRLNEQLLLQQKELKLLFLQNCCRASLSMLQSFSGQALRRMFVLASQTILGAPNNYYRALLVSLFSDPIPPPPAGGDDDDDMGLVLAGRIKDFEAMENYGVLACFRMAAWEAHASAVQSLLRHVVPVLETKSGDWSQRVVHTLLRDFIMTYRVSGVVGGGELDRYVDLLELLRVLSSEAAAAAVGGGGGGAVTEERRTGVDKSHAPDSECRHQDDIARQFQLFSEAQAKLISFRALSDCCSGYSHYSGLVAFFPFGAHALVRPPSPDAVYPFSLWDSDSDNVFSGAENTEGSASEPLVGVYSLFAHAEWNYKRSFEQTVANMALKRGAVPPSTAIWIPSWKKKQLLEQEKGKMIPKDTTDVTPLIIPDGYISNTQVLISKIKNSD
jgi:hypothetical protein